MGLGGTEQCRNRAVVFLIQPGLGALQHRGEAIPPGDVQPGRIRPLRVGRAVTVADREFDIAMQPLQIGHLDHIAEVGLGGQRHRGDDLVATRSHRLGVTGDVIEQSTASRCGVIDLVNVGAKLTTPGSHSITGFSGTDPVLGADRVDEHLLDRVRGGGLQTGHGGGAEEDSVNRHQRIAVGARPSPGEIFGSALRRADSTAHADGDVGLRTQFGVGNQQKIVEIFPGMVTTGTTALDMGDHTLGGRLGGDPDDSADLFDGAGLEADVRNADVVKLVDQLDGILEVGHPGADDQTVDGGAGLTSLLHQTLTANLQLPQVGIQEQGVELDHPAGLQQRAQFGHAPLENLLRDLAAAGKLGPVPGIGGGGDDLRVHRCGRHPGQQDR